MAHGRPRRLAISRTALSDRKAEARDGLPRELDGSLTRDFDDWELLVGKAAGGASSGRQAAWRRGASDSGAQAITCDAQRSRSGDTDTPECVKRRVENSAARFGLAFRQSHSVPEAPRMLNFRSSAESRVERSMDHAFHWHAFHWHSTDKVTYSIVRHTFIGKYSLCTSPVHTRRRFTSA